MVTRTSRFRRIWISSLRAMASMVVPLCEGRAGPGAALLGADGAEDVVEPGGPGLEVAQLHRVVPRPVQEDVQVLLEAGGLDEEGTVALGHAGERRFRGGRRQGE